MLKSGSRPGRVPGRAGGQLLALHQHDVRPALLGEMIERRDADHASADHHDARMRFHSATPLRSAGSARACFIGRTVRRRALKATRDCSGEAFGGSLSRAGALPPVPHDRTPSSPRSAIFGPASRLARQLPGIRVACRGRLGQAALRHRHRRRRHLRRDARLSAAAEGQEASRRRPPPAAPRQHRGEHRAAAVRDRHAALRACRSRSAATRRSAPGGAR